MKCNPGLENSGKSQVAVEAFSLKFAELFSLLNKNDEALTVSGPSRRNLMTSYRRTGRACEYYTKMKHTVPECWKRELDNNLRSFRSKKGHDAREC